METFYEIMRWLAGPLIGAVIGLFTNYIAVKMMFRPYEEVRIWGWRVPFTPGIIPRRKAALAGALGRMVSESLVQEQDLKNALLSEEITGTVVEGILSLPPLDPGGRTLMGEQYDVQRERLLTSLTDRIVAGLCSLDLAALIAKEGKNLFAGTNNRNPLLAMFLNEGTIASLAPTVATRLQAYLAGDGREKLYEILDKELNEIEQKPVGEMLGDPGEMRPLLTGLYQKLVSDHADAIARQFHIAEVVEQKVNAMDAAELEALVLTAMKKELNAVIRLGAVIGFVLGLLNTLINHFPA